MPTAYAGRSSATQRTRGLGYLHVAVDDHSGYEAATMNDGKRV
jgi:hypothetical protein